jgi:hypothetical protein
MGGKPLKTIRTVSVCGGTDKHKAASKLTAKGTYLETKAREQPTMSFSELLEKDPALVYAIMRMGYLKYTKEENERKRKQKRLRRYGLA